LNNVIKRIRNDRGFTPETLRLDMAERGSAFPDDFFEKAIESITQLDFLAYPDYADIRKLEAKLVDRFKSRKFSFDQECITDSGSDGIIKLCIEAFCTSARSTIFYISPSFPMYHVYGQALGVSTTAIGLDTKELRPTVKEIVDALYGGPGGVLFLSNPNSPYGTVYADEEIDVIVSACEQSETICVLDEAYIEFSHWALHENLTESANLLRLKTFSKAGGLAGLRFGFAIGSSKLIEELKRVQLTFPTTTVTLKVADQLIDHWQVVKDYVDQVKLSRAEIVRILSEANFSVMDSHTNSLHFRHDNLKSGMIQTLCSENDVLIKSGSNIGTPVRVPGDDNEDWVRMSLIPGLESTAFFRSLLEFCS